MMQIGVVQCIMAPGVLFFGTTQLWDTDVLRLGSTFMKVMTTAVRMEAMLSFVLSLNRLKIMCGLQYPSAVHTTVAIAAWIFGIVYFTLLMTPYCDYLVIPGQFLSQYDLTKPWTATVAEVGSVSLVTTVTLTFVAYLIIVLYLIYIQHKSGKIPNFKKEKPILFYGMLRFIVDITLAILFNFGHLPHTHWVDFPVLLGYTLNNLLLPWILYLCLYDFVLALNRLKIMCGLHYPSIIHRIILIASWMFGVALFTALMTPCCDYIIIPGNLVTRYDYTKPYSELVQRIGGAVLVVSIFFTLVIYLAITAYLIHMQIKNGKIPNFQREKAILFYGGLRFICDMTMAILFNYAQLPKFH
ncbi:hypothetical protein QR680_015641 [Steinernema hermaphroditum]|uniref:7TM GPCR serpentine receptor class x (Srx) domain-containing protein n=1 Tax=Steinernema hermaphroditum TaxID=289476 RepID=A0AA39H9K3_9BILA|nr:hypothetical protein QR680_015641 [Steinernema hermaphroditum]